MCFKPSTINPNRALAYKLILVSSLLAFWIFYPLLVSGVGEGWPDGFEDYELNSDLDGQGGWVVADRGGDEILVQNTKVRSGSQAIFTNYIASNYGWGKGVVEDALSKGTAEFWILSDYTGANNDELLVLVGGIYTGETTAYIYFSKEKEVFYRIGAQYTKLGDLPDNTWASMEIEFDTPEKLVRYNWNTLGWTEWVANKDDTECEPYRIGFNFNRWTSDYEYYFDDIKLEAPPPPPVSVWGVSPDSATEITDLNTNFTFGFEGLENYDGLLISFYNQATRIHTNALRFDKTDIGVEGEKVVNLQDFYFEKNANWHLNAIAFVEVPETYSGLYLTGRYITEYTQNVVSPEYYLVINIEGFPVVFEMENWGDWYDTYSKFDDATLLFERVATLFTPTFNNIGEFGQTISDYFEVDKAYSRGYELGLAIPIFAYYTTAIEMFFGGLPIIKLFMMILLLLTGIFVFKIVMKFIPFLS